MATVQGLEESSSVRLWLKYCSTYLDGEIMFAGWCRVCGWTQIVLAWLSDSGRNNNIVLFPNTIVHTCNKHSAVTLNSVP